MCIKTGIKMRVTPEQSRKVQEICIENGIGWGWNKEVVRYINEPYLFIDDAISFMYKDQEEFFVKEKNEEVSAELFIRTNGTCIESETPTESNPSEEPQPKTLSEYLKENNAYESFVENCVEAFLEDLAWYKVFKSENKRISLGNMFIWEDTKEGQKYWLNLYNKQPKNLVYDMNEIIFAEVDKRIAEQKSSKRYMVFVEGKNTPRYIHDSYDSAETEAKRLSTKLVGSKVFVVEIIKEYKSKVVIDELSN